MVHAQCTYNILKDALLDSVVLSHPIQRVWQGVVSKMLTEYIHICKYLLTRWYHIKSINTGPSVHLIVTCVYRTHLVDICL